VIAAEACAAGCASLPGAAEGFAPGLDVGQREALVEPGRVEIFFCALGEHNSVRSYHDVCPPQLLLVCLHLIWSRILSITSWPWRGVMPFPTIQPDRGACEDGMACRPALHSISGLPITLGTTMRIASNNRVPVLACPVLEEEAGFLPRIRIAGLPQACPG
jgi:hypothetical protein